MLYFWSGGKGKLKLISLGSERATAPPLILRLEGERRNNPPGCNGAFKGNTLFWGPINRTLLRGASSYAHRGGLVFTPLVPCLVSRYIQSLYLYIQKPACHLLLAKRKPCHPPHHSQPKSGELGPERLKILTLEGEIQATINQTNGQTRPKALSHACRSL